MQPPDPSTLPRWLLQETCANNGRYLTQLSREHIPTLRAQPYWLLDAPVEQVRIFGDATSLDPLELRNGDRVSLPLADAYASRLADGLRRAGWCWPTSSWRTVIPVGVDGWAVKLHVPDSIRSRVSERMGSKVINAADAAMACAFSTLLRRIGGDASPFLGVVEEPCSMVTTVGSEVGAILRRLPEAALVPGFSIYSRPQRPLGGKLPAGVEMVRAKLPDAPSHAEVIDRCLALFVEPLLDIFFSLASRGVTLQVHGQNILFEMEPDSRATRRVWVRDMHGVNYAPELRASRGLDDILPAIIEEVGASAELVRCWLERRGQRRRMFEERFIFGHSYDLHVSAFFYQLMVGFWRAGLLRYRDLEPARRAIQQRAAAAAAHYDFDTALLVPRYPARQSIMASLVRGIARHPPFRPRP